MAEKIVSTEQQDNNLLLQRMDEANAKFKEIPGLAAVLIARVAVGPTFNQDHPDFENIEPGQRFDISLWKSDEEGVFKVHLVKGKTGPLVDFTREQIENGGLVWESEHPDIQRSNMLSKIWNFFQ